MDYHSHMAIEQYLDYKDRPLRDMESVDTLPHIKTNVLHTSRLMTNTWLESRAGVGGESGGHRGAVFVNSYDKNDCVFKTLIVLSIDRSDWSLDIRNRPRIKEIRFKASMPDDNSYSMGFVKKGVIDKYKRKPALFLKL